VLGEKLFFILQIFLFKYFQHLSSFFTDKGKNAEHHVWIFQVRMNTILGWQVFSPIPFSEYHPDIVFSSTNTRPKELDINKTYGHYDTREISHIAFYARDYTTGDYVMCICF